MGQIYLPPPPPKAPDDMPAGYMVPESHVGTFHFTWRHYAFFWGIAASIAEALLITYGRMPR